MDLPPHHHWFPSVFTPQECRVLETQLLDGVNWETHVFRIFGRSIEMPREIAFMGPWAYSYSGTTHGPQAFPPYLTPVLNRVSQVSGHPFNTLLLNHYEDGSKSMGWHSDDDYDTGGYPAVASLSLGATRRFRVRTRDRKNAWSLELSAGGLLVMEGESQRETEHSLPKTARACGPRINLTFRHMIQPN